MNEFRDRVFAGKSRSASLLAAKKTGRTAAPEQAAAEASGDRLGAIIPRDAPRTIDTREGERHRLLRRQEATASWNGRSYAVEIVNLSGGGAMIAAPFRPRIWDRLFLSLGGCGELECAVIWIKNDRIGLEFAHETRIDANPETWEALLREVIARSFPHVELPPVAPVAKAGPDEATSPEPEPPAGDDAREETRHPLIWRGHIHYDHRSTPVRLRNVSADGALVEADREFPLDAEVLLDLADGGQVFATVQWTSGDQYGLRFHAKFDVRQLAKVTPEVASSQWVKPDYLGDTSVDTSPWASRWARLTVEELDRTLKR